MLELINQKVEGQEITVAPEAPAGKVIDLMEALKARLGMCEGATSASRRSPPRPEGRGGAEEEGRVEEEVVGSGSLDAAQIRWQMRGIGELDQLSTVAA